MLGHGGVPSIGPGKDMAKSPVLDELFAFAAGADGVCFCHGHTQTLSPLFARERR